MPHSRRKVTTIALSALAIGVAGAALAIADDPSPAPVVNDRGVSPARPAESIAKPLDPMVARVVDLASAKMQTVADGRIVIRGVSKLDPGDVCMYVVESDGLTAGGCTPATQARRTGVNVSRSDEASKKFEIVYWDPNGSSTLSVEGTPVSGTDGVFAFATIQHEQALTVRRLGGLPDTRLGDTGPSPITSFRVQP